MPPEPKAEIVAEVLDDTIRFYCASADALQVLRDTAGAYGQFVEFGSPGPHRLFVAPLYDVLVVAAHYAGEHVTIVRPPRASGTVGAVH